MMENNVETFRRLCVLVVCCGIKYQRFAKKEEIGPFHHVAYQQIIT